MMPPPTFLWYNIKVVLLGKNRPANFDKTNYQTLPIIIYFTLFLFIYFTAPQKTPTVDLGARLMQTRSWPLTSHCNS